MASKKDVKIADNAALLQGISPVPGQEGQAVDFHDDLQVVATHKAPLLTADEEELQPRAVDSADEQAAAETAVDSAPLQMAEVTTAGGTDMAAGEASHPADSVHDYTEIALDDPSQPLLMAEAGAGGGGLAGLGGGALALGGVGLAVVGGGAAFDQSRGEDEQPVRVVVERTGAFIDTDADGVHDESETEAAVFAAGGNASLLDHQVIVHFNDVPHTSLDLTGFTPEDRIQLDVASLQSHGVLMTYWGSGNYDFSPYQLGAPGSTSKGLDVVQGSSQQIQFHFGYGYNTFTVQEYPGQGTNLGGTKLSQVYALNVDNMASYQQSKYGSTTSALMAHWHDAHNPLNNQGLVLPDYNGTNTTTVVNHIDAGSNNGLIDFIWPDQVYVAVDSDGAFIDANHNGIHEGTETERATFSQGGNADLAANNVFIDFTAVPENAVDLSGFGKDDRVMIDIHAIQGGTARNLATSYSAINGITASSTYGFGFHDNQWAFTKSTSGYGAVFITKSNSNALQVGFYSSSEFYGTLGTLAVGLNNVNPNVLDVDYNHMISFVVPYSDSE